MKLRFNCFFNNKAKMITPVRNIGDLQTFSNDMLLEIFFLLSPFEQIMFSWTCKYLHYFKKHFELLNEEFLIHKSGLYNLDIKPLGYAFKHDCALGSVDIYFRQHDPAIGFINCFLQSLYTPKKKFSFFNDTTGLNQQLVKGITGKEMCFTLFISEIALRINAKNIKEILQLFGNDQFPLGANFKLINTLNDQTKYIDDVCQLPISFSNENIFFQIYYQNKTIAFLVSIFFINSLKRYYPSILKENSPHVDDQLNFNNLSESIVSIPINSFFTAGKDTLQNFKKCLNRIFRNKLALSLNLTFDEIKKLWVQTSDKKSRSDCRIM